MKVFEFASISSFLAYMQDHYPGARRSISLDRWAKKLGYKSPRSIAMVINGQRLCTPELLLAVAKDLKLSQSERRYLELLLQKEKFTAKKGVVPQEILDELKELQSHSNTKSPIDPAVLAYFSDTYHFVIKHIIASDNFVHDAKWIAKKLRHKLSAAEIERSLDLMTKLGMIECDPKTGRPRLAKKEPLISTEDIPSSTIRTLMAQELDRAKQAIHEQSIMEREFTSLIFRMDPKKLEAKKFIREFRDRFDHKFAVDDKCNHVYQLNIQLFANTTEDP